MVERGDVFLHTPNLREVLVEETFLGGTSARGRPSLFATRNWRPASQDL